MKKRKKVGELCVCGEGEREGVGGVKEERSFT